MATMLNLGYYVYVCPLPSSSWEGARMAQWVRSLDLTTHTSLSPIRRGFSPGFVYYKKGCTRLAAVSDKVYQLLAQGRWFFPGTPASSTTKTGLHDIAEILLKVALKHQKSKSIKSSSWEYLKRYTTQKTKIMSNTILAKKPGMNQCVHGKQLGVNRCDQI